MGQKRGGRQLQSKMESIYMVKRRKVGVMVGRKSEANEKGREYEDRWIGQVNKDGGVERIEK